MITIKERNKNIRVFYTTTSGCFKIEHGDVIIQNMGMFSHFSFHVNPERG